MNQRQKISDIIPIIKGMLERPRAESWCQEPQLKWKGKQEEEEGQKFSITTRPLSAAWSASPNRSKSLVHS